MALFQSSTYSTIMHESRIQSRDGVPLSAVVPSPQACTISQLVAFPSSLAAFKRGIRWNASCWVAKRRLDEFEQQQIAEYAFQAQERTPHIEWCHFASDVDDQVSMLVVFPELRASFRSPDIMERWTDTVVLPAFRTLGILDGVLTSSFKVIQMTAEAEREQTLDKYAPDTPLVEMLARKGGLHARDMQNLWTAIQEHANKTTFFTGFRNLFLVLTCRQPNISMLGSTDKIAPLLTTTWDDAIDMTFVPLSSVRANSHVAVHPHLDGGDLISTYQPDAQSQWESSKKRKADADTDSGKRFRAGVAQGRTSSTTTTFDEPAAAATSSKLSSEVPVDLDHVLSDLSVETDAPMDGDIEMAM